MSGFAVGMCCGLALMGCVWLAFESLCRPSSRPEPKAEAESVEPELEYPDPTLAADYWKPEGWQPEDRSCPY